MKVRVFLPTDETLEPFAYGEFEFDVMPLEGHILRFTDFEDADYPVERVGYIQAEQAFVGAIWLGPPHPLAARLSEIAESAEPVSSARADGGDERLLTSPSKEVEGALFEA